MMGGVLVAVVWTVVALVVAELAARFFISTQARYLVNPPHVRKILELDPALSAHMEAEARFETNHIGERGAELPQDLGGIVRIVVIGGSAGQCYLLDQRSSWPERMGAYLREMGVASRCGLRDVHVGNLSHSELTSGGARRIVACVLPRYRRLDAVVLMVGISDMLRWLRVGVPTAITEQPVSDVFDIHPEGPFGWVPRSTGLAELGRRIRDRWLRWREPVIRRRKVGTSVVASRARKQQAETIINDVPDSAPMLASYRKNLGDLISALTKKGATVVVAGQPHFNSQLASDVERSQFWNGGVGDSVGAPVTTYYSDRVLDVLADQINSTARAVAGDHRVPFVDLDPVVPSGLRYYYDQFHFTPAGSDLVGRAVAEALARVWSDGSPAGAGAVPHILDDHTARTRTAM